VAFEGAVRPSESGSYNFVVSYGDGVKFWFNGQLLLDDWRTGVISLRFTVIV